MRTALQDESNRRRHDDRNAILCEFLEPKCGQHANRVKRETASRYFFEARYSQMYFPRTLNSKWRFISSKTIIFPIQFRIVRVRILREQSVFRLCSRVCHVLRLRDLLRNGYLIVVTNCHVNGLWKLFIDYHSLNVK